MGETRQRRAPLWMILSAAAFMLATWLLGVYVYDTNTASAWHGSALIIAAFFYGTWFEQRVLKPLADERDERDGGDNCREKSGDNPTPLA